MTSVGSKDASLWETFVRSENDFYKARMALLSSARDLSALIASALNNANERGTALRLLAILPEESVRFHARKLVELASVGHSDIGASRFLLLKILKEGTEEEYRRIAELYRDLDDELLRRHLARCAASSNIEVREIAADFRQ